MDAVTVIDFETTELSPAQGDRASAPVPRGEASNAYPLPARRGCLG